MIGMSSGFPFEGPKEVANGQRSTYVLRMYPARHSFVNSIQSTGVRIATSCSISLFFSPEDRCESAHSQVARYVLLRAVLRRCLASRRQSRRRRRGMHRRLGGKTGRSFLLPCWTHGVAMIKFADGDVIRVAPSSTREDIPCS
jgi:hypothetical protein